jgi:hypothetical protein
MNGRLELFVYLDESHGKSFKSTGIVRLESTTKRTGQERREEEVYRSKREYLRY